MHLMVDIQRRFAGKVSYRVTLENLTDVLNTDMYEASLKIDKKCRSEEKSISFCRTYLYICCFDWSWWSFAVGNSLRKKSVFIINCCHEYAVWHRSLNLALAIEISGAFELSFYLNILTWYGSGTCMLLQSDLLCAWFYSHNLEHIWCSTLYWIFRIPIYILVDWFMGGVVHFT